MKVVGLDLSLTSTGVAIVTRHEAITQRITSTGRKDATLITRQARLHQLHNDICLMAAGADLVVIEGPSFGQARQGGQHDRAGLWWLVVHRLHLERTPVAEVPPSVRAKYATGRGRAAKDDVLTAVVRRYASVDVNGNDEADSLVLASLGARYLGHPIDDPMPKVNLTAMTAISWPKIPAGDAA